MANNGSACVCSKRKHCFRVPIRKNRTTNSTVQCDVLGGAVADAFRSPPLTACELAAWLPGCLAAWLPGCLAAWLPGCLAAWLPCCLAAWLPRLDSLAACLGLTAWLPASARVLWLPSCPSASLSICLPGCLAAWLPARPATELRPFACLPLTGCSPGCLSAEKQQPRGVTQRFDKCARSKMCPWFQDMKLINLKLRNSGAEVSAASRLVMHVMSIREGSAETKRCSVRI